MNEGISLRWRAYGALVMVLSFFHYAVLSRFGKSDEGGVAWFRKRLNPELPAPAKARRIWIHAVSAGESKVADLLRQRLLARDPELSVVLSSTTYSGFARIRSIAGPDASFIMPLDTLWAQRRILRELRPDMLVLVESEYWPAQFEAACEAGIPVLIVNATMSPRSFARHRRHPAIARRTIARATRIYAQDETIAARYADLGVPKAKIEVAGNLKLVPSKHLESFPKTSQAVVFGSVHRDEIEALVPPIVAVLAARPELQIVLVPRYPGRISREFLHDHFGAGLRVVQHLSEVGDAGALVWLDEMGTLAELYRRASVGVVCGTFADIGGHDLAEPLHAGAVSVYGPDVSRQLPMHGALATIGCAVQVASASELALALIRLMDDTSRRQSMVEAFRAVSVAAEKRLQVVVDDLLARL